MFRFVFGLLFALLISIGIPKHFGYAPYHTYKTATPTLLNNF